MQPVDKKHFKRVLKMAKAKTRTAGGIILADPSIDAQEYLQYTGRVIKMGPLCYAETAKFGHKPWCKERDWVLIGRYSGARFKLEDGAEVRIINDDEVIGTILNPDDIVSFR